MPDAPEYVLTSEAPGDENLIYGSWLKSYLESFKYPKTLGNGRRVYCYSMPKTAYYDWQHNRIDQIRARQPLVVVARDPDQPVFVYGYGIFERIGNAFVAHWVYVKNGPGGAWRQSGIAKAILRHALEQIGGDATRLLTTHKTWIEEDHGVATRLGFELVKLEQLYRSKEAA